MISKYSLKKYILDNSDKLPIIYNEEQDAVYNKKTNEYVSSLNTFLDYFRIESGESFECIYHDPASLLTVLRCTECKTVILSYDDERYDSNLKCPTCTDYQPHFEFWTKEDIDNDVKKQKSIKYFKEITNLENEKYERSKKRNGKHDWEIVKKEIYGKKYYLSIILECDDIKKSHIRGLRLNIHIGSKKNKEDYGYIVKNFFVIPLSWSQLYKRIIYKYFNKFKSNKK